jgi:hypothetical protein
MGHRRGYRPCYGPSKGLALACGALQWAIDGASDGGVLRQAKLGGPAGDAFGEEGLAVAGILADDVVELAEQLK